MNKLKPHLHSFGFNLVHIVFVTKYRHPVINEAIEIRLQELIEKLCKTQDCELIDTTWKVSRKSGVQRCLN